MSGTPEACDQAMKKIIHLEPRLQSVLLEYLTKDGKSAMSSPEWVTARGRIAHERLDQRVPGTAAAALALPAEVSGAAGLADVAALRPRHA